MNSAESSGSVRGGGESLARLALLRRRVLEGFSSDLSMMAAERHSRKTRKFVSESMESVYI